MLFLVAGPAGLFLQMIHDELASLWVVLAVVAAGIPLTILLTLQYGIEGAAFAKVVTLTAAGLGAYVVLRRRHKVSVAPLGRSA